MYFTYLKANISLLSSPAKEFKPSHPIQHGDIGSPFLYIQLSLSENLIMLSVILLLKITYIIST